MITPLSADSEAFIAGLISQGFFPTREAVLERCLGALREQLGDIPELPPEHQAALDEAFESLGKFGANEFNAEAREQLLNGVLAQLAAERARAAG